MLAVQAAVLMLQRLQGPRWWIPGRLLPPRYDYFRVVAPAVLPGEGACSGRQGATTCGCRGRWLCESRELAYGRPVGRPVLAVPPCPVRPFLLHVHHAVRCEMMKRAARVEKT